MLDRTRSLLPAAALLALGLVAGRLWADPPRSAFAENRSEEGNAYMEVIANGKTNEPAIFIYDQASRRLLMYTLVAGKELQLAAVRNTAYDTRVQEYKNANESGMSVRELKKAFEEEELKEREAARKRAEEEAKKGAKKAT